MGAEFSRIYGIYNLFFRLEKIREQMRNVYDAAIAPVQGIHSLLCGRA